MNFKTTYLLFGLLAAMLAVFAVTQLFKPAGEESTGYVFPSLSGDKVKSEHIERVEIQRFAPRLKDEKLVCTRKDKHWYLESPAIRLDGTTIDQLITQIMRLSREEKSVDLTSDLAQFGLDKPRMTITLDKAGDDPKQWKLNIGDESAGKDRAIVYVNSSDRPKEVLAVKRFNLETAFKSLNELRSKDLLSEGFLSFPEVCQSLRLAGPSSEVVLEKVKDNQWRFKKPAYGDAEEQADAVPMGRDDANRAGWRPLLQAIGNLRVDTKDFVADEVADMAPYGLSDDKPATMAINVKRKTGVGEDAKEVEETLLIGNKIVPSWWEVTEKDAKYYARLKNEKSVVRIDAKKLEPVLTVLNKPDTLRGRDLVALDQVKTDVLDITNSTGQVKLRKVGTPAGWKVFDFGKLQQADGMLVEKIIGGLLAKRAVLEFPGADKTDADLGFDKPTATLSVWVEGLKPPEKKEEKKDDKKEEKKDEKKEEKKDDKKKEEAVTEPSSKPAVKLVFGKKDKDKVYVQRTVGDDVSRVVVASTLVEDLTKNANAFLDRDLVKMDPLRTDVIEIKIGTLTLKLWKPEQEWKYATDGGKPQKADVQSLQMLQFALTTPRQIKDFLDPKTKEAELGLDKPDVTVAIWADGIDREEKKDGDKAGEKKEDKKAEPKKEEAALKIKGEPKIKLAFGKRDKGIVYVRRQIADDVAIVTVPDTLFTTVSKGPLAYKERKLPDFADADVSKIAVQRDGVIQVVNKETKDNNTVWKYEQPKEQAGKDANTTSVANVLLYLKTMHPSEWETEKASDAQLDTVYGLKTPALKVTTTVMKDKKPEERAFLFGKETADKKSVYAKLSDQDAVFTVGPELVAALRMGLQDPTVLQFAVDKVRGLKLVGWQDVALSTITLDLERKSAQEWVAKTPKEFAIDPAKAESFITLLSNLRAEEFTTAGSTPKPEQFDLKAGTLEIELTLAEEKEPVKLSVGAPDVSARYYYGKSSKLPGQVFMLKKELFEKWKATPRSLGK
jgi:hypothetical protein